MKISHSLQIKLTALLESKSLSEEEKAAVKELLDNWNNEVYSCSYDKTYILTQAVQYAINVMGCTQCDDEIETKISGNKDFFNEVAEDLSSYDEYPTDSDVGETVDNLMDKHFEVDDYGELFYRGLADM